MEDWNWPPKYNNNYFPPTESRYWFPVRETMDAGVRDTAILLRLQQVCTYAYLNSSFYRKKWDDAGFHPSTLRSLEDFETKCPVITKADLRESQLKAPPFGDYLCISDSEVCRIHGTSGTTGRPTAFAIGRDDWKAIGNAHARMMWGMGIRPDDIVFIAAILSLYMGGWGALVGAERIRAKALPFGAGASGMSTRAAHWLDSIKPAAFYGTPSFALHLAEVAKSEHLEPLNFNIKRMFFSGEPGASMPGVRDKLREHFGAQIFDCGSMAEMTPFMHLAGTEQSEGGMLCYQDIVYTEVCDPKTFVRVNSGERGTPVYTHLERLSQPMIRLASNDLTMWEFDHNPCGRTYPRLPYGIFGRIDDMFTIRGENVYPSEIDSTLSSIAGYGGEHRIVITRESSMDELLLQVEPTEDLEQKGRLAIEQFRNEVFQELSRMLGLRTRVEIIKSKSLPRTDFKAKRVVDDRKVFQEMHLKLDLVLTQ